MTRQDVVKMFFLVKSAYPKFYRDFGEEKTKYYIESWFMVFANVDTVSAFKGLKVYMSTETSGFPPSPGQIMDCIHRLTPDELPNEMEAWTLVDRAVRNSNYNAQEEFDRLPMVVKRAVRNPARLREWAQMDIATYQTVEQSNFMRTYRAEVENERRNQRIPSDIRPQLEVIETPAVMIEERTEHEKAAAPDADIEAMIARLEAV